MQTSTSLAAIHGNTAGTTLTKIGAGTLTLTNNPGGTSLAGGTFVDNQGDVVMDFSYAMGSKTVPLNIIMNAGTTLHSDFSNAGRPGGSLTLNSATIVHDNTGSDFDEQYSANTAADVWTINGNSKIQNAEILTLPTAENFCLTACHQTERFHAIQRNLAQ